jgi:hypothetical protein
MWQAICILIYLPQIFDSPRLLNDLARTIFYFIVDFQRHQSVGQQRVRGGRVQVRALPPPLYHRAVVQDSQVGGSCGSLLTSLKGHSLEFEFGLRGMIGFPKLGETLSAINIFSAASCTINLYIKFFNFFATTFLFSPFACNTL